MNAPLNPRDITSVAAIWELDSTAVTCLDACLACSSKAARSAHALRLQLASADAAAFRDMLFVCAASARSTAQAILLRSSSAAHKAATTAALCSRIVEAGAVLGFSTAEGPYRAAADACDRFERAERAAVPNHSARTI